jgi:hypothetical protein
MPATVTFNALPGTEQWSANITYVSPAAIIIEGVATYTIKLALNETGNNLKVGLTANIVVPAATKENVLAIPRRAVTIRDQQEYVSVVAHDETIIEKPITTGLVSSDGTVEVTAGLSRGEKVVINPGQLEAKP